MVGIGPSALPSVFFSHYDSLNFLFLVDFHLKWASVGSGRYGSR